MHKWLGTVNEGYGVYTNVTLHGAGSVSLASGAQMPRFAADFSGAVSLPASSLAFAIRGDAVEGALDFGGGTLSLPAACTLNVTFDPAPRTGVYRLVSAGGLAIPVEWTLNVTSASGSTRRRTCRVVVTDGNVDLHVDPAGISVSFR